MDRQGAFPKSDLYSYARANGIERLALDFLYRCRKKGTIREIGANRVVVLVPGGQNLGQFYKDLLQIQGEPVLQGRPKPPVRKKKGPDQEEEKEPEKDRKKAPSQLALKRELPKEKEELPLEMEQPAKPAPEEKPLVEVPNLANEVERLLEERFKRLDDTVASINSLVGDRINDLEQRVSGVIVKELEKRIRQLEAQLEECRAKAEAFDLIKRDAWEIIQALDIVGAEREDVKKVLKKFL